eukprot:352507-Chlamydomonas_euryale.AAC.18
MHEVLHVVVKSGREARKAAAPLTPTSAGGVTAGSSPNAPATPLASTYSSSMHSSPIAIEADDRNSGPHSMGACSAYSLGRMSSMLSPSFRRSSLSMGRPSLERAPSAQPFFLTDSSVAASNEAMGAMGARPPSLKLARTSTASGGISRGLADFENMFNCDHDSA